MDPTQNKYSLLCLNADEPYTTQTRIYRALIRTGPTQNTRIYHALSEWALHETHEFIVL